MEHAMVIVSPLERSVREDIYILVCSQVYLYQTPVSVSEAIAQVVMATTATRSRCAGFHPHR